MRALRRLTELLAWYWVGLAGITAGVAWSSRAFPSPVSRGLEVVAIVLLGATMWGYLAWIASMMRVKPSFGRAER